MPMQAEFVPDRVSASRNPLLIINYIKRWTGLCVLWITAAMTSVNVRAETKHYPPQSAYLMTQDAEIALARSAAPSHISDKATIKVLTTQGYKVAADGSNGFVCIVMRGWGNSGTYTPVQFRLLGYDATIRAPICFVPSAVKTILPYVEMKDSLGMQGKTPDQIADAVQLAYATGKLPKREGVTFAYMWSADQHLNAGADGEGLGLGHGWHPHMMVYAPYFDNSMLGNNPFGSLPIVGDDEGTPFAVIYIPLDHKLLIAPDHPVAGLLPH